MAIRKHRAGELVIEQTRDLGLVRGMLERGGMMTEGIEWPAACYIVAYVGDEAVGLCLREEFHPITKNTSYFVPHYFIKN